VAWCRWRRGPPRNSPSTCFSSRRTWLVLPGYRESITAQTQPLAAYLGSATWSRQRRGLFHDCNTTPCDHISYTTAEKSPQNPA
jgi:hypothetical protein